MVGIGITTFNRNIQLIYTLARIKKYTPKNVKIVIVDDGSTVPVQKATFRFEKNQGAPIAKNKCLELLEDCEHIFLFDDDTYPIKTGWINAYISAGVNHLNYTFKFNSRIVNGLRHLEKPNGCMMYIHNSVLKKVGGYDTGFIKYGHWHGAFSNRVKNLGLTPHPFIDIIDSDKYIFCKDQESGHRSATPNQNAYLPQNKRRYLAKVNSTEYIPYKSEVNIWYSNPFSIEKNIGKALNDFCELVPDNDWICLQDGDMMYLTPDWGVQISEVVKTYGKDYSLFGCVTNRLGRRTQRIKDEIDDNHNILDHYKIAMDLKIANWGKVKALDRKENIAGMFMLFPKKLWRDVKFRENDIAFDDSFSRDVKRKNHKMAVMTGLYVYHFYRGWSDNPVCDRNHLK